MFAHPCTTPQLIVQADWHPTWNKPTAIRDARTNQTNFDYYETGNGKSLPSAVRRPASIAGAARPTYSFTYNSMGKVLDATDPTGLILRSIYAPINGNRTSIALDPSGTNAVTGFGYDAMGNLTSITDPRTNVTELAYDKIRRNTVTEHHNGGITAALLAAERTTYDALGQVTAEESGVTFSGAAVTAWQLRRSIDYTDTGKIYTQTNGAEETTTHSYDAMDRLIERSDPLSRRTRWQYDLAGQQLKEIRAYGTALQQDYATYTYTPNGQRQTVKDANSNLSTFEYDGFDRLARLRFPVATSGANQSSTSDDELYGYDSNGNRTSLTKRDDSVIGFAYDALNRMTFKDIPSTTTEDVYYDYDLAGRPRYVRFGSTSGSGIDYGYDTAKRLTSETQYSRAVSFGYDLAGNRNRVTWPDTNFISYSFDAMNRMTEVRESSATPGSGVLATYGYDVFSRRDSITRANAANSDYGYDSASRLTSLAHNFSGSAQDLSLGFGYTLASQLRTRTSSNRVFDWATILPDRTYVANGRNQYSSVSGTAYAYDANGNLTSDGSRTFQYDVENRLTSVSGSANQTLSYDPNGRLQQAVSGATTVQFLYDGDRLVAEYNGSGTLVRRYVHGPGTDDPIVWYEGGTLTDKRWLHADERGSIIASSNSSAAATTYLYGPYGEPASWSGARFAYTGQAALNSAKLYYYKARFYDPQLGRFLQTDPVGYDDDFNLYAYVGNDPLNRVDPTGMWWDIPQPIVDFSVGLGDVAIGATLGLVTGGGFTGPDARAALGIDGGVTESGAYINGVGAGLLATAGLGRLGLGSAESSASGKTYTTYTRTQAETSKVYSGRTSGTGAAEQQVKARTSAADHQQKTRQGYGPAVVDKNSSNAAAIRGREQQLIEQNGGAQSQGGTSGNAINGVSPANPKADQYRQACLKEFGCP